MILRFVSIVLALLLAAAAPAAEPRRNGVDDAVLAFFQATRTGNDAASAKAAAAVVAFGGEAVPRLTGSLTDRTSRELVWVLRCLREIASDRGKEAAFALCSHADPLVRAEAVWTAATLGGASSVPLMMRASTDSDDAVRRRAFDGILEHGPQADGSLAAAMKGIFDSDFWVVLAGVQILHCQPVPAAGAPDRVLRELARIVDKLDDRNSRPLFDVVVRRAGSGSEAGSIVAAALSRKQPFAVIAALEAAGRLRLSSAISQISRLAAGSDVTVATAAIDCLSQINDPASVPTLVDLLESSHDPVRTDALAVALRRITGLLHGTDVSAWRRYVEQVNR